MQLNDALSAVRQFHEKMGAPVGKVPRLLPGNASDAEAVAKRLADLADETANLATGSDDLLLHRAAMALEELAEWLAAHAQGDLVAVADAWADRAYVLLGDAVAGGLPAVELFAEVHRSNMTKEPDSAGTGKAIKGPAYKPPNLQSLLSSGPEIPPTQQTRSRETNRKTR